ncbi:MAG: DUF3143 domain-containing protein [Synechococcaceae cyanobacterium]
MSRSAARQPALDSVPSPAPIPAMAPLPPDTTPLYNHPLPALEDWLRQLGARPDGPHAVNWDLHHDQWSARIALGVEELTVTWHQDGHQRVRQFPYGLARTDVEAAILAGP